MNMFVDFSHKTGNLIFLLAPFVLLGPVFLGLALGVSAKPAAWTWAPAVLGPVLLGLWHTRSDLTLIAASVKRMDPGLQEQLLGTATEAANLGISSGAVVSLALALFALLVLGIKLLVGAKEPENRRRVRGALAAIVLALPGLCVLTGGGTPRWLLGAVVAVVTLGAAVAALRSGFERSELGMALLSALLPLLIWAWVV